MLPVESQHVSPNFPSIGALQERELVDRVAQSELFQRSPKLRELLLYVARCTLAGRPEEAREQQIAQVVFNRKADYNPGQDNIVRVEARLLRKRLEVYFLAEGLKEPLIITMPKGSYSLRFEERDKAGPCDVVSAEPGGASARDAETTTGVAQLSATPLPAVLKSNLFRAVFGTKTVVILAGLLLAGLAVTFFVRPRFLPESHPSSLSQGLPFSALFNASKETYVVTSDTALVIIQHLVGQRIRLNDYINRQYPAGPPGSALADLVRTLQYRNYTNADEMRTASAIILQNRNLSPHISMRSARSIQLPELKERNILLIGSPESNPWGQLYYDNLPFQFDANHTGVIRNAKPRPGEQAEYSTPTDSGQTGDAYAILALVPNFGDGSALLIAGKTAEATCAAGEFALDRSLMSRALKVMGIDAAGVPKYFELLLKARTLPGSATSPVVVAWRRLS